VKVGVEAGDLCDANETGSRLLMWIANHMEIQRSEIIAGIRIERGRLANKGSIAKLSLAALETRDRGRNQGESGTLAHG